MGMGANEGPQKDRGEMIGLIQAAVERVSFFDTRGKLRSVH